MLTFMMKRKSTGNGSCAFQKGYPSQANRTAAQHREKKQTDKIDAEIESETEKQ